MITKEVIYKEIEKLGEEELDKLYDVIKKLPYIRQQTKKASLMARLRRIQIDGPEDFAANLDLYVSGEKHA